jgi:hypothetical protein
MLDSRFSDDLKDIKKEKAALQSSIKSNIMRTKECDDKADRLINNRKQTARQKVSDAMTVSVSVSVGESRE